MKPIHMFALWWRHICLLMNQYRIRKPIFVCLVHFCRNAYRHIVNLGWMDWNRLCGFLMQMHSSIIDMFKHDSKYYMSPSVRQQIFWGRSDSPPAICWPSPVRLLWDTNLCWRQLIAAQIIDAHVFSASQNRFPTTYSYNIFTHEMSRRNVATNAMSQRSQFGDRLRLIGVMPFMPHL